MLIVVNGGDFFLCFLLNSVIIWRKYYHMIEKDHHLKKHLSMFYSSAIISLLCFPSRSNVTSVRWCVPLPRSLQKFVPFHCWLSAYPLFTQRVACPPTSRWFVFKSHRYGRGLDLIMFVTTKLLFKLTTIPETIKGLFSMFWPLSHMLPRRSPPPHPTLGSLYVEHA